MGRIQQPDRDAAILPLEKELKKPAQKTQAKNIRSKRICMFSANDSWLSNFIPGRSSDLAITALRRLPGEESPVTQLAQRSRLTATSSCRICTCFPFHPGRIDGFIPDTADALFTYLVSYHILMRLSKVRFAGEFS